MRAGFSVTSWWPSGLLFYFTKRAEESLEEIVERQRGSSISGTIRIPMFNRNVSSIVALERKWREEDKL